MKIFFASLLIFISIVSFSFSADITWTGAVSGDLDNTNNWDTLAVPTESDNAIIAGAGTAPYTGTCYSATVVSSGTIGGGTWNGTVENSGTITSYADEQTAYYPYMNASVRNLAGGSIQYIFAYVDCTNDSGGTISGGYFYSNLENSGEISDYNYVSVYGELRNKPGGIFRSGESYNTINNIYNEGNYYGGTTITGSVMNTGAGSYFGPNSLGEITVTNMNGGVFYCMSCYATVYNSTDGADWQSSGIYAGNYYGPVFLRAFGVIKNAWGSAPVFTNTVTFDDPGTLSGWIIDGVFNGIVTGNCNSVQITGGTFNSNVYLTCVNAGYAIYGGGSIFNGDVELNNSDIGSVDPLYGNAPIFNGMVTINWGSWAYYGDFFGNVYNSYLTDSRCNFYGNVTNSGSLAGMFGTNCVIDNRSGFLNAGTTSTNYGLIIGGTLPTSTIITNGDTGRISGGFLNQGTIYGGTLATNCFLTNDNAATLSGITSLGYINNAAGGIIGDGNYGGTFDNYSGISTGTFLGTFNNKNTGIITNGVFSGTVINEEGAQISGDDTFAEIPTFSGTVNFQSNSVAIKGGAIFSGTIILTNEPVYVFNTNCDFSGLKHIQFRNSKSFGLGSGINATEILGMQ